MTATATRTEKSNKFRIAKQLSIKLYFLVHFFAVVANHDVKVPNFTFHGERQHKTKISFV